MIPGEMLIEDGEIVLNAGRDTVTLAVANTGDRPIQVGSHYHFFETNPALEFEREKARGMRLDIAAGTAVRFEPGQTREVTLVGFAGARTVYGFRQEIMGKLKKQQRAGRSLPAELSQSAAKIEQVVVSVYKAAFARDRDGPTVCSNPRRGNVRAD